MLQTCEANDLFHVELSAPHPFQSKTTIKKLLLDYRKRGFEFTIHNYFPPQPRDFVLNIASSDETILRKSRNLVIQALILGREIESPVYGLHPGYLSDGYAGQNGMFRFRPQKNDYRRCLEKMAESIGQIIKNTASCGVTLILENLFPGKAENYSLGCTFEEIKDILSLVPEEVGLLLDLGHLSVAGQILKFDKYLFLGKYLSEFGPRLCEVHLSENIGDEDKHLPLTEQSWQLEVLREICSIPSKKVFSRIYCLEVRTNSNLDSIKQSLDLINPVING